MSDNCTFLWAEQINNELNLLSNAYLFDNQFFQCFLSNPEKRKVQLTIVKKWPQTGLFHKYKFDFLTNSQYSLCKQIKSS